MRRVTSRIVRDVGPTPAESYIFHLAAEGAVNPRLPVPCDLMVHTCRYRLTTAGTPGIFNAEVQCRLDEDSPWQTVYTEQISGVTETAVTSVGEGYSRYSLSSTAAKGLGLEWRYVLTPEVGTYIDGVVEFTVVGFFSLDLDSDVVGRPADDELTYATMPG